MFWSNHIRCRYLIIHIQFISTLTQVNLKYSFSIVIIVPTNAVLFTTSGSAGVGAVGVVGSLGWKRFLRLSIWLFAVSSRLACFTERLCFRCFRLCDLRCFGRVILETLDDREELAELAELEDLESLRLRDRCFGDTVVVILAGFVSFCLYASLRIFKFKLDVFGLTSAGFEILSTLAGAVGKEAGVVGGSAAKSTITYCETKILTSTCSLSFNWFCWWFLECSRIITSKWIRTSKKWISKEY